MRTAPTGPKNGRLEQPPSATANGQAVNTSVPAQAHLAAAQRVDGGIVGGRQREPGPVEVARHELTLRERAASRVDPRAHFRSDGRRDHMDLGTEVDEGLDLAGGDAAGADNHDAPAAYDALAGNGNVQSGSTSTRSA